MQTSRAISHGPLRASNPAKRAFKNPRFPKPGATSSSPVPYELSIDEVVGASAVARIFAFGSICFEMLGDADAGSGTLDADLHRGRPLFTIRDNSAERPQLEPAKESPHRGSLHLATRPPVWEHSDSSWTLDGPFVRIVGFYPPDREDGRFEAKQSRWLARELRRAPVDKALVVASHRPISGAVPLASVLAEAINVSKRIPNLVLSAHSHKFGHVQRTIGGVGVPFIVAGNAGYLSLRGAAGAVSPAGVMETKQKKLFSLSISATEVRGEFTGYSGQAASAGPSFIATSEALFLRAGETASLD